MAQLSCAASQIKSPVISVARVLYMLTPFRVPDAREWPHDWLMLRRVEPHNVFRRVWHPGSRGTATNPKRCAHVDDIIGRQRPMMVSYFRIIVSKVYLSQPFSINIMSDRIAAMPRAAIISMIYPLTGADILRTPGYIPEISFFREGSLAPENPRVITALGTGSSLEK
jgi:hypothetical protein